MAATQIDIRRRARKNNFQEHCFRPTYAEDLKSPVPERSGIFFVRYFLSAIKIYEIDRVDDP